MKKGKDVFSLLNEMLSFIPIYVYWLNKNNVYEGCSDLFARLVGLKCSKEIQGKRNQELPCNASSPKVAEILDQNNLTVLETGISQLFEEKVIPFDVNEKQKVFLSNKSPIWNEDQKIVGVLGVCFDITERKHVEEELKEEKEQITLTLEQIIAYLPGHVYWKDKNGIYLGCNDLQAKSLGFKQGYEVVGKTDFELPWKKGTAQIFRKNDLEVMNSQKAKSVEEKAIISGQEAVVLSHKVPLINKNNESIGVLGISLDITELKNAQIALAEQVKKTERVYRSKTEFINTASHEIRGSVSNVISFLEIVKNEINELQNVFYKKLMSTIDKKDHTENLKNINELFNKISNNIEIADTCAYRSLTSLKNLGDLHQIQTKGVKSYFEPVDIQGMIEDIVSKNSLVGQLKIKVKIDIEPNIPKYLNIDYENIWEALRIVIGNAIRFSKEKSLVRIQVELKAEKKQNFLVIIVQDFGEGISPEQLKTLFKVAFDESSEENIKYRKPSLQLPQAKLRIEATGGSLKITSSLKNGTIATLATPYFISDDKHFGVQETLVKQNNFRILIVEDDLVTQQLEKKYLEQMGYIVDIATKGAEAIQFIQHTSYKIVLIDITLPDMNGIEVINQFKQKTVPPYIVAVTSHVSEEDIAYFLEQGVTDVIEKPVTKQKFQYLLETISKIETQENNEDGN